VTNLKARWLLTPALIVGGLAALAARALAVQRTAGPRQVYWRGQATGSGPLLVALGDSLTQGTGSSGPSTSWVGLFRAELEQRWGTPVRVDNRAVYGAKLADLVANQLPVPADAALVVMCIGSNDAGRTSVEEFRTEFGKVCAQLPAGSIVGDVPEFQWGPRVPAAAAFSQVVRDVLADYPDLIHAELEKHTHKMNLLREFAPDFFHPNDAGYRRVAAAFVDALQAREAAHSVHE
jgi:acyl-CoA thioesterase-1